LRLTDELSSVSETLELVKEEEGERLELEVVLPLLKVEEEDTAKLAAVVFEAPKIAAVTEENPYKDLK